MRKLELLSILVYLIVLNSCNTQPETKYNTSTLNLKGNIKHITERKNDGSPNLIDIEFKENSVFFIKTENPTTEYLFQYEDQKLNYINRKGELIKPENFPLAFELLQPLLTYNADSVVRNNNQDPIKVFFNGKNTNEVKVYRIEYMYDHFNNWIVRDLYYDTNNVVIERAERKILYARVVTKNEITTWNAQVDSIFKECKTRSSLGTLIDTTIDKNKERLKEIDAYVSKYNNDVVSTGTTVTKLVDSFNKTYGQENLSPELQKIQKKLDYLHRLALNERFFYNEVSLVVPLLVSGKKSVKDKTDPFTNRYTLTYTFELMADIKHLVRKYETDFRK
ncbi:hypothetical protein FAM09_08060 [Niastella caeni]|uniref:Uncharacterized protein n=1 Tax=Niastella caeni TaxID=2569763 RepID=A0A4S8I239_9BACT|nr:hypothetical protein [Niastella caeni]THU39842.1 hypothetical protein FAM09_08060 [Niastella caeni]